MVTAGTDGTARLTFECSPLANDLNIFESRVNRHLLSLSSFSAGKGNNKNTKTRCKICSKLTIRH